MPRLMTPARAHPLRRLVAMLAAVAAVSAPCAMATQPQGINPDVLTISGRYGLPKANNLITHRKLRIAEITLDPEVTTDTGDSDAGFKTALEQALIKSLANHDLLAGPDVAEAVNLRIEMPAYTFTEVADADGKPGTTSAVALIKVTTTSTDPGVITCVTSDGRGEFKALHRQHSGDGKRAAGIIAGVLIAAINPYAINTFTSESFSNADVENRTLNANRSTSSNEGVSPGFDARSNKSYAALNATQLAIYNYLHHQLSENPACVDANAASPPQPDAATTPIAVTGSPPPEVKAQPAPPAPETQPPAAAPPPSPPSGT